MAGGRPKIEINYKLAESLAGIFCTEEEIATIIGCSVSTLQHDQEFLRVFKKGKETAKSSLRRTQWKLAQNNATMAIWLGKQYLGQRDIPEEDDEDINKQAKEIIVSIKKAVENNE